MPIVDHSVTAARIHADLPVVDGHNDLPWEIRMQAGGSLEVADPRTHLDGYHTDFPRMIAGGVGVQFWSVYVPTWTPSPLATVNEQIDLVTEMCALGAEFTELASSTSQAKAIRESGRIAGFMGAEGGHSIEGSLAAIEQLHERGVRYMTLTHADTIDWADSATDEERHGGLTEFGEQVVVEMNRVGMLVDISHVSAATMRHAVQTSRAPVIASHSSVFALAPHPRNVPDDVIESVAAGGGVVMVTFVPAFLVESTARIEVDMFEEERELRSQFGPDQEAEYAAASKARGEQLDLDVGSVIDVVDHIEHIAEVGGVDHVGIGSDFDGTDQLPAGLEDASCYPAITVEMLSRGWTEPDIRKVLGGNALRVLEDAEQHGA